MTQNVGPWWMLPSSHPSTPHALASPNRNQNSSTKQDLDSCSPNNGDKIITPKSYLSQKKETLDRKLRCISWSSHSHFNALDTLCKEDSGSSSVSSNSSPIFPPSRCNAVSKNRGRIARSWYGSSLSNSCEIHNDCEKEEKATSVNSKLVKSRKFNQQTNGLGPPEPTETLLHNEANGYGACGTNTSEAINPFNDATELKENVSLLNGVAKKLKPEKMYSKNNPLSASTNLQNRWSKKITASTSAHELSQNFPSTASIHTKPSLVRAKITYSPPTFQFSSQRQPLLAANHVPNGKLCIVSSSSDIKTTTNSADHTTSRDGECDKNTGAFSHLIHRTSSERSTTNSTATNTSSDRSYPSERKRSLKAFRIDSIVPGIKSFVTRKTMVGSHSAGGLNTKGEFSSARMLPTIIVDHSEPCDDANGRRIRKCSTTITLSTSSSKTTLIAEPVQATNRLRVTASTSNVCSRCSSLLSLATSGSRYSLNTASATFVQVPPVLCKLCLSEVPPSNIFLLLNCNCNFCRSCMEAYVSFEISEGAYDISCPDAQCPSQGVISLPEIEKLIDEKLVEKHKKYRLNREVDIDKNRTWCPRAGCETVCNLCPTEKCTPQSVHCPTCASDFCSNCKQPWHDEKTCEEQARLNGNELTLGVPFESDLIKCCPMCNVPIEKDEGCAQMMCKRCKHVFCWYCLTSLDDDFLLRHYDKGPCKNKLGHSRASVIWHRTQVIGIFAGFGILLLVASPLLLLAAPCIVCCKCRICNNAAKLEGDDDLPPLD